MPTGYTADVQSGKITTLREYALQCARAFGATITLRDDPLSAEIPEFQPSDYNLKKIDEANKAIEELESLTAEEIKIKCQEYNDLEMKAYIDRLEENEVQLTRYKAMLEKAKAFQPPTNDHINFKEFMVSQLTESISFDIYRPEKPEPLKPDEWLTASLDKERRSIEYNTEANAKEIERTKDRNQWVSDLKKSL